MYICIHCGHHFEEPSNRYNKRWSDSDDSEQYCPNCGSEDFEEAEHCELCDAWKPVDDVINGCCRGCLEEHATKENAFLLGAEYKENGINGLIAYAWDTFDMEMELVKSVTAKDAKTYCMDDPWVFAEFIKRRIEK